MPRHARTACSVAAAVVVAALAAACGGAHHSAKSGSTDPSPSSTGTSTAPAVAVSGHAPNTNIAVVDGTPITFASYQHWLTAALTSQASQEGSHQVVVPLWPPDFSDCVSGALREVPSLKDKGTASVKSACQKLFATVNDEALDFLIEGIWYQDYGAAHGVTVTAAQVSATFDRERNASFKSTAAFNAYLKQNGETPADLIFRTRVNLYYKALVAKAASGSAKTSQAEQAAEQKLITEVEAAYRAKTACATGYATALCAS